MNERIKELAKKAEILLIEDHWDYNDREVLVKKDGEWHKALPSEIIHTIFQSERGLEKFAESIIRECIDWCDAHATIDGTAQKIVESIKKDFGVER